MAGHFEATAASHDDDDDDAPMIRTTSTTGGDYVNGRLPGGGAHREHLATVRADDDQPVTSALHSFTGDIPELSTGADWPHSNRHHHHHHGVDQLGDLYTSYLTTPYTRWINNSSYEVMFTVQSLSLRLNYYVNSHCVILTCFNICVLMIGIFYLSLQ